MKVMLIGRIEQVEGPTQDREWWFVQCPAIGAWTQGHSRKDACFMLVDCIETLVHAPGFKVTATEIGPAGKGFDVLIDANRRELLAARMLVYQREMHKLSRATVAKRSGVSAKTLIAYEEGRAIPSLDTLSELLDIVAPELALIMGPRVIPAARASKPRRVRPRRSRAA